MEDRNKLTPTVDHTCVQLSIRSLTTPPPTPRNSRIQQPRSSVVGQTPCHVRTSISLASKGVLSFHEINYAIADKRRRCPCLPCFKSRSSKSIINNVSGRFSAGMNAIMGPTGCGKSTLLDILADRKDPKGLSGEVLIDGQSPPNSYKYIVGYVVQDDIISGTLTVRENLMFSANVRLSNDVSDIERKHRVNKIIEDLSLLSCADTRVGTELLRGISGGQRKRTCIGMELVLSPKLLFLDEPTTGLDASTARSVMQCLKDLSQTGRTIVFSIHQPRYSIFKLFDRILLMSDGKSIYHGSTEAMMPYFNAQGYHCDLHDNPADFVLDLLVDAGYHPDTLAKLHQAYEKSSMAKDSLPKPSSVDADIPHYRRQPQGAAARSLQTEIFYVAQRTLRNAVRNPALFLCQIVVSLTMGLLIGSVFYNLQTTTDPGVQNRLGAISFMVVSQIFSTVTALDPLLKERALFIHEHVSGYYRISTFFIAKLICDILPMRIIPSFIFSIIAYFMTSLQRSAPQFFIFLVTIFMVSVFGSALCFFVAASIPNLTVALIVIILMFVIMMIFSGFLVDLATLSSWLSWVQWVSAFRYGSNVLNINEFRNLTFCLANATSICPLTGMDVLHRQGLDYSTDWDLWKHFFALTIMTAVFLLFALIQLCAHEKE